MCFELDLVMGIIASYTVPSSSSKTDMHRIPTSGHLKRRACLTNNTTFITSPNATYLRTCAFWRLKIRKDLRTSPILRFPTSYKRPYRRKQRQQTPARSSLPLYPSQTQFRINSSVSNALRNQALPSVVQGLVRHST